MASGRSPRAVPAHWAAAALVAALVGLVTIGVLGPRLDRGAIASPAPASETQSPDSARPTDAAAPADAEVPDFLRHVWGRPIPVTPDLDQWVSGFVELSAEVVDYGPVPGPAASRSALDAVGIDRLVVTATAETRGCSIGDVGEYRWSIGGKGTVMTLAVIDADACPGREPALDGQWVRSDFPPGGTGEQALLAGPHVTVAFDPFGTSGASGQLSYTVGPGWEVIVDEPSAFVLHQYPDASAGQASGDALLFLLAQPRAAADFEPGASCGPFIEAAGIGSGVGEILTAIIARPGVASTPPAGVKIDGFEGQMVDLDLAPDWNGGCRSPDGPLVGVPILVGGGLGLGLSLGIGRDRPMRLVLLDLGRGRTMSIAMVPAETSQVAVFQDWVKSTVPMIEGFRFHEPVP